MQIEYTSEQMALQPKLEAANINPESFLATDYLNHFNEIVMLLEMVPDMPELVEDTADWAPKSYPQHFLDSGFQAADLAVEAFEKAPRPIRLAFDQICNEMDNLIQTTLAGLVSLNVAERGFSPAAQDLIRQRVLAIQELLMKLNQVIHGKLDTDSAFFESLDEEEPT
ncbi:MAG: hypothetical protein AB3N28_02435, partial [Kordiimonas sp.]